MKNQDTSSRAGITEIAQEFMAGFVETSRAAFFAMLVGFAAMAGFMLWYFSYATLGGPLGQYLPRSGKDIEAYSTYRALQIGNETDTSPLVLILGSSVSAAAFASEGMTQAAVSEKTGEQWRVAMFTTALQSPIDQFALIETALKSARQENKRVVIVLGVDVTLNGWSPEQILELDVEPRLGLRSDWADAEIERLGGSVRPRSSVYVLENWRFFVLNGSKTMMRLISQRPARPRYTDFTPVESLPEAERKSALITTQIKGSYDPENEGYLSSLRVLAGHLSAYENVDLILMHELPSPDLIEASDLDPIIVAEQARYQNFADEIGALYWSPFRELNISGEAFHDHYHIGKVEPQAQIRAALADNIAQLQEGNAND